MFCCPFWIDVETKDPAKRVVVCVAGEERFVESPNTAWAVLRAAIRSDKAGGIISGSKDNLTACVSAIEQADQRWPADPHQIVAQITTLAQRLGCTVIFRQNLKAEAAAVWAVLDACGLAAGPLEGDDVRGFRTTVVGPEASITTARYALQGKAVVAATHPTRLVVALPRPRAVAVEARSAPSQNEFGVSVATTLSFQKAFDVYDDLFQTLGPVIRQGYKFALLVRESSYSRLFLGTGRAGSIQQAIAQYGNHLRGVEAEDDDQKVDLPATSGCRFWRFSQ